ncbi:MAG: hypothetical protein QFF03_00660 [Pseudomonadota bacterium]|nr:hypothetical protein [Pseudomonadota bacterium]
MQRLAFIRFGRCLITACAFALCFSGCGTTKKMSPEHLLAIGVSEGVMYWVAEQKLASEGYQCFVTGEKRENFDCTKTQGFFPTCVLRVTFKVNDKNGLSALQVANPACIGTP